MQNENKQAQYNNILVIESEAYSNYYDIRYIILDKETGEILDDAQGYGYKSKRAAYAAWAYKHRDRTKELEKANKQKPVVEWLKKHIEFTKALMKDIDDYDESRIGYYFDVDTKKWNDKELESMDKYRIEAAKRMLKENNLEIDFTVEALVEALTDNWKMLDRFVDKTSKHKNRKANHTRHS